MSNDLLRAADASERSVLLLLDFSLALDSVYHEILLSRLNHSVGISGLGLLWFSSFLADMSFSVCMSELSLASGSPTCGVPQGSVLGPILFSLYIFILLYVLLQVFSSFNGISYFYADDTQLSGSLKPQHLHILFSLVD